MQALQSTIIQFKRLVFSSCFIISCSDSFTSFSDTDAKQERANESGYRPNPIYHVRERETDATTASQIDAGVPLPESSIDSGSEPDAAIRVQDSGRSETQVMKPWWESNPEGVCVSGNPKQCASGCSCVHNGQAWCCI